MVVTFCGHKDIYESESVKREVELVVEQLISEGAVTFYLGGYGEFDSIVAHTVKSLKQNHTNIRTILVLPYIDRKYNINLYDESTFPPLESVPRRYAIIRRNEWMVDQSDVVVAYVNHGWGGAAQTLVYAKKKKKRIINLGGYEG